MVTDKIFITNYYISERVGGEAKADVLVLISDLWLRL